METIDKVKKSEEELHEALKLYNRLNPYEQLVLQKYPSNKMKEEITKFVSHKTVFRFKSREEFDSFINLLNTMGYSIEFYGQKADEVCDKWFADYESWLDIWYCHSGYLSCIHDLFEYYDIYPPKINEGTLQEDNLEISNTDRWVRKQLKNPNVINNTKQLRLFTMFKDLSEESICITAKKDGFNKKCINLSAWTFDFGEYPLMPRPTQMRRVVLNNGLCEIVIDEVYHEFIPALKKVY